MIMTESFLTNLKIYFKTWSAKVDKQLDEVYTFMKKMKLFQDDVKLQVSQIK